eukprot:TRINITY_DN2446_c0_g1_i1.p1 TRINITY_DN2446_c0_g1~~TRINITY_DN2446_c0_g1_i1.p1  ORF type:complete len:143 (+),score=19.46 TRINITY_DN2446_c0_g1_i1:328-756(+)
MGKHRVAQHAIGRALSSSSSKTVNRGQQQQVKSEDVSSESQSGSFLSTTSDGHIQVKVAAKPGAKRSAITGILDDRVGVAIAAPAVEGKANDELVSYLREVLGVRKSEISLDKGLRGRAKVVIVRADLSVEEVQRRILAEVD